MPSTAPEITVTVKLFAGLRRYAPAGADPRAFAATVPPGTTLRELAEHLRLPPSLWKLAFRNNARCVRADRLRDGDIIAFFPPIAGG